MTRKSPTRTVRICKVPRITVRIDSKPCVGLPWKSGFKYTLFTGTLFIEGEQIGTPGIWRDSPNGAVEDSVGGLYRFLLDAARKVDAITPFYKSGHMHTARDGTANSSPYWIIEGTHEAETRCGRLDV